MVTDIGTTRDAIDTKFDRFGFEFNLGYCGIRRKAKEDLEFYSVMRLRAIEHADICILDY
jgi:GTP-binding protein